MNRDMATAYLDYVAERHRIWQRRQTVEGTGTHWTDDPILRTRKFTNDFRILDHGSQFLVKELLYGDDAEDLTAEDALARCYLYRMTNRPDVWQAYKREVGDYPFAEDMNNRLADLWCQFRDNGGQVFSGAYVIMPAPGVAGVDKTRAVIRNADRMFNSPEHDGFPMAMFMQGSMKERFQLLRMQPAVGDFIAMQVLTDFGYWDPQQDENEFVVPGPGCRNGAREIFPEKKAEWVIGWAMNETRNLGGNPPLLYGRPLSPMDIQNTLCEFSKYARYMRKPPKHAPFQPAHPGKQPKPFLPPHWI